ncbi:MAG: tyrosine-type recombinase/integrase [Thaumarchaeota archaeon]|nr:tyrosine-type recombinase/integrase [Nitrososphaerota archaeon]
MLWDSTDKFLDRAYRKSKSDNSVRHYRVGIKGFKQFCDAQGVKSIDESNVYALLDDWVGAQDKRGLKPQTIVNNVSAVRRFLAYNDIAIDSDRFKSKVTLPRTMKIADQPLSMDSVRTLLTRGRPSPKNRALVLTLLSSGIRIGEALSVRWKDVDLSKSPATINLRVEITKTREARTPFLSEEAKDALQRLKGNAKEDDLVFTYAGADVHQREKSCNRTFREMVARAGLDAKIEGHRIHTLHFHVFRKNFFTKAADTIGDQAAHALLGHNPYMSTYYVKSEEDRVTDYKKLESYLTTSIPKPMMTEKEVQDIILATLSALALPGGDESLQAAGVPPDIIKSVREELASQTSKANGPSQRTVRPDELDAALREGWTAKLQLADGRILLERVA